MHGAKIAFEIGLDMSEGTKGTKNNQMILNFKGNRKTNYRGRGIFREEQLAYSNSVA